MNQTLFPGRLHGTAAAIPSKSQAHRLLLCAALAGAPSELSCGGMSEDIAATVDCLRAMGAEITRRGDRIAVRPIQPVRAACVLPCRESGSTLRFLLPVVGALGLTGHFQMEGRLPERPMGPLTDALTAHGMEIRRDGDRLCFRGRLLPGRYELPGDISSQYLTGLLFALPLLPGDSTLRITTPLQSKGYLQMTLDTLAQCGILLAETGEGFRVPGGQRPRIPDGCRVEGDWSNAAFFLCAGAISGPVAVTGLRPDSAQGDRAILELLRRFGAKVETAPNRVAVSPGPLHGIFIDAGEIPDLIPALAAVAAAADGETVVTNAGRLRLKESDRLAAIAALLRNLGGSVIERPDGLVIRGGAPLVGGTADSRGDHRIAMAAAVCSLLCQGSVTVTGAECVKKSDPDFWSDFLSLRQEAT
ncbi:MAG: 3-phosphoshikimate 1-carboxyvinyltransferase [Oscillospiraceae bacterium]|nr:3-phosphoshikimate 1-carboxyvinyltransferase [Oscillospiraceae bacterium]